MSCSADETDAASVLSKLSENVVAQLIETSDTSMIAHQCDVETTSNQDSAVLAVDETLPLPEQSCINSESMRVPPVTNVCQTGVVSSVKVYPCEYCGKVFNKSYNLKTHHRVHSGERPYQCGQCGHAFANLGDLKRHDRTHTGEKPYMCEFCNKCFSDFGSHKRHLRLHTGYTPFKCEKCQREFTRIDSYKNHIRLHTGVRPYKCEECQKEFNYLTTFKRHQNTHNGARPHACDQCGKRFTRSIYVKNHQLNNCGKQKGAMSQKKPNASSGAAAVVAISDATNLNHQEITRNDSMIGNLSHDISLQGGVQLNVSKVIYTNGGTQNVLFESNETTSHTLILTTNPEGGQQLLELTTTGARSDAESALSSGTANTATFFEQSLTTQIVASKSQQDAVIAGNPSEHAQTSGLSVEKTGEGLGYQGSCKMTVKDEGGCSSSARSAMYIALDPTQDIVAELHAIVDS